MHAAADLLMGVKPQADRLPAARSGVPARWRAAVNDDGDARLVIRAEQCLAEAVTMSSPDLLPAPGTAASRARAPAPGRRAARCPHRRSLHARSASRLCRELRRVHVREQRDGRRTAVLRTMSPDQLPAPRRRCLRHLLRAPISWYSSASRLSRSCWSLRAVGTSSEVGSAEVSSG